MFFDTVNSRFKMKILFFKGNRTSLNKHCIELRITSIFLLEFMEFLAKSCLPCVVLNKYTCLLKPVKDFKTFCWLILFSARKHSLNAVDGGNFNKSFQKL